MENRRREGSLVKCQHCPRNRESIADFGVRIEDLSEPGAITTSSSNLESEI